MAGTNVFIKFLPSYINDEELFSLFSTFGSIISAKVMIDQFSCVSRGYGFVRYSKPEEAAKAIESMSGHRIGNKSLLCKLSDSFSFPDPSCNLYVKPLPLNMTEAQLLEIFKLCGHILTVKLVSYEMKISDSVIGLVRFEHISSATRAIHKYNGAKLFPNLPALVVKYAESEDQKVTRRGRIEDENTNDDNTDNTDNNDNNDNNEPIKYSNLNNNNNNHESDLHINPVYNPTCGCNNYHMQPQYGLVIYNPINNYHYVPNYVPNYIPNYNNNNNNNNNNNSNNSNNNNSINNNNNNHHSHYPTYPSQ